MLDTITNMPGKEFLVLYGIVIACTIVGCKILLMIADRTSGARLPDAPKEPNPYAVAYLRGQEKEVVRVVIFNLVQRGFLETADVTGGTLSSIKQSDSPPDTSELSPLEKDVFDHFLVPHTAHEVFRSTLADYIRSHCQELQIGLEVHDLVATPSHRTQSVLWMAVGGTIILGLGAYKLTVALSRGYTNVGFLIGMGLISTVALVFLCKPHHLTRRGKKYLAKLQESFGPLKTETDAASTSSLAYDPMLLTVGIFGTTALAGTAYAGLHDVFQQAPPGGGGGYGGGYGGTCGGGCGGGCSCGGGGCGGGCGGCGG